MQEAVKRFVESRIDAARRINAQNGKEKEYGHGLTLIDMPTGSGKTYNAISLLKEYIEGECLQEIERVFYLTPLNKNVKDAYEDLRKLFSKEGKESLFEENCLWIQSNSQCVIERLKEVTGEIPDVIKRKESFKDLNQRVDYLKSLDGQPQGPAIANMKAACENDIMLKYEPRFREDIKKEVKKLGDNEKERLAAITRQWPWLLKLYPSILTSKRKVLFMSVDKFCRNNDTIVGKSYRFINDDCTKGALVFIDEIDASKEFVLRSQIEACSQRKIDLFRLFSTLTASLASKKKFPSEMFEGPSEEPKKTSRYAFSEMEKVLLQRRQEFHLDYSFKLEKGKNEDKNFLFQDHSIHTISSADKNNQIYIQTDERKNQNIIKTVGKADPTFYQMVYGMNGALSFVRKAIVLMSRNYLSYYNNRKKGRNDDLMQIEEAVSTILSPFELDDGMQQSLKRMAVDDLALPRAKTKKSIVDSDFYMDGFRYFDFIDDISHDTTTSISMCFLNETPEKFLYSLCSRAIVVGISATANIKTVTGNYNLPYLEMRLGDAYYKLPKEDKERMRDALKREQDKQKYRIDVTTFAAEGESSEDLAKEIFTAQDSIDVLSNILRTEGDLWPQKRYIKTIKAIRSFLLNPKGKAMIVLTNNNLKNGNDAYSKETIRKIIGFIQHETGDRSRVEIHALFGNTFEKEKEAYRKEIREGAKVILFTSYPSASTGQNLQYSVFEGEDEKHEMQKDIDTIYLEKPTYILVNTNPKHSDDQRLTEEDLMKAIYQAESLRSIGEVSPAKSADMIKKAFKTFMGSFYKGKNQLNEYKTESVINHSVKILEQAIGRICRTRDTNKNDVNIYVDEEIYKSLNFKSVEGKAMNREFQAFISKGGEGQSLCNDLQKAQNVADDRSERLSKKLDSLMKSNKIRWSEDDMEAWRKVREIVLRHPTWTKKEAADSGVTNLYADYPWGRLKNILYYSKNEDTGSIETSFTNRKGYACEVSENDSNLKALCALPAVRAYFEQHGYAMEWKKDECILNPIAYTNLYKGALGEAAGLALVSKTGIPIQEIKEEEKFEKFDFFDGGDIYFDFKNWRSGNAQSNEDNLDHIDDKLSRVNGKKAFIINMVAEPEFKVHDNGRVCQIPSLVIIENGIPTVNEEAVRTLCNKYLEAKRDGPHE